MTETKDFVLLNHDINIVKNEFEDGISISKNGLELKISGSNAKTSPYLLGEIGFSIYNIALYRYRGTNYERAALIATLNSIKNNEKTRENSRLIKNIREGVLPEKSDKKLTASDFIYSYIQKNAQTPDFYINLNTNETGIIITPNKSHNYIPILIRYMLTSAENPNLLADIKEKISPEIKKYKEKQDEKNRIEFERQQRISNRAKGIAT